MKRNNKCIIYLLLFSLFTCKSNNEKANYVNKNQTNSKKKIDLVDTLLINKLRKAKYPVMTLIKGGNYSGVLPTLFGSRKNTLHSAQFPDKIFYVSDFEISKTEISVRQFALFVKTTGYVTCSENKKMNAILPFLSVDTENSKMNWRYSSAGEVLKEENYDEPVKWITKYDALKYAEWLSKDSEYNYDLPTFFEYYVALSDLKDSKNYDLHAVFNKTPISSIYSFKNIPNASKVASKLPNHYGLYDLIGNVAEYTKDKNVFSYMDTIKNYSDRFCSQEDENYSAFVTFGLSSFHTNDLVFSGFCQVINFYKEYSSEKRIIAADTGFRVVRRKKK